MKLAIGLLIAHGFPVPEQFEQTYRALWSRLISGACNAELPDHLKVDGVTELRQTSFPIDFCRNEICRAFLTTDADALLFLDMDQTFAPDTAERLIRAEKPVITGRYHMRKPPFHAVAFVKHAVKNGRHAYAPVHFGRGVFPIERGGAGCLLIQREVIAAIQARQLGQWAAFLHSPEAAACPGWLRATWPAAPTTQWFRYQHGPDAPHDLSVSEDFWFYQQVREAGYQAWCDWDCACGHLQTFALDRAWNLTYLDKQIADLPSLPPEKRTEILNSLVVCGYPDGLTLPTGDHLAPYTVTAGER